eukprot:m.132196 g.132196  ORF g.132196 m.132196 type:complete len:94 (-) comp14804_c0_seq1:336-617(-)
MLTLVQTTGLLSPPASPAPGSCLEPTLHSYQALWLPPTCFRPEPRKAAQAPCEERRTRRDGATLNGHINNHALPDFRSQRKTDTHTTPSLTTD